MDRLLPASTPGLAGQPAATAVAAREAGGQMLSIQAARGIAALLVVLLHTGTLMEVPHFSGHPGLGGMFSAGYVGVDFFFVLSGFIITYVHFADIGQPARIPSYLWRRFSRIYPIYWVTLALAAAVLVAGRMVLGKSTPLGLEWIDLAGTFLLIQAAALPKLVEVGWTLQYEVMFYTLFVVLLLHRRIGLVCMAVWAAAIGLRIAGLFDANPVGFFSAHSLEFIIGVCTGLACRRWRLAQLGPWALAAAVVAFAAAVAFERRVVVPHSDAGRIALGLASSAILLCLVALEKQQRITTPAWLHQLGSVSYSIYLSHIVFLSISFSLLLKLGLYHRLPEAVVYGIAAGTALVCAVLLGRLVELPLVDRLKPWVRAPRRAG